MAKLGFLGLGIMGYPMAEHLLKAGHDVALWSNTAAKAQELAGKYSGHGKAFATPKEVAENADVIFLCVGDTAMSRDAILGDNGLLHGAKAGTVIADCSTVAPSSAKAIGKELEAKGIHYLDAPVTGSKPGATNATLTFMIGGDEGVYNSVKPYMEIMGKQFFYCGKLGMGLHAKLTQNLVLCNIMQAFNEGLVLATKAGVDPALMLQVLDNSAAKSGLISFKAPYVLKRDFQTNFSTKWMHKDIELMLESAAELGVPLPITGLTQQMFRAAMAMGHADDDFCSTVTVHEQWAGVEVKGKA